MTKIYFATNRNPLPPDNPSDFGSTFSQDGLANLRFGYAEVPENNNDPIQITVAPENLFSEPPVLGSQIIFEEVRREMREHAEDTLIFIHGFNTSFHNALRQAAQLHRILTGTDPLNPNNPLKLNMCVFSWPSDGTLLLTDPRSRDAVAYRNDRLDAAASGAAFARGFLKVADFINNQGERCQQRIHLFAHSMGAYVLRFAVQEIRKFVPDQMPRVFDQIVLVAADEDDDAFDYDHKYHLLPRLTRHVNVYFNRGDLALWASDRLKGNPARLGTDGPLQPLQLPRNVYPIDCTEVVARLAEATEHSYHLTVERVATDIRQVLRNRMADEIPGRRYVAASNHYRLLLPS